MFSSFPCCLFRKSELRSHVSLYISAKLPWVFARELWHSLILVMGYIRLLYRCFKAITVDGVHVSQEIFSQQPTVFSSALRRTGWVVLSHQRKSWNKLDTKRAMLFSGKKQRTETFSAHYYVSLTRGSASFCYSSRTLASFTASYFPCSLVLRSSRKHGPFPGRNQSKYRGSKQRVYVLWKLD